MAPPGLKTFYGFRVISPYKVLWLSCPAVGHRNRVTERRIAMPRKVVKKITRPYSRQMVRIRSSGTLNAGGSRSSEVITTVPANKVLVIETISANIRIPETTPLPQVARLAIVTGSAFPPNTGSPLIDLPITRMATDPAGNFVNYVGLANMRAYATDGLVQYSIDLSKPSSGAFDVSLFGYLVPADSPSLAP
jgi:hypothetical protein